MSKIYLIGLEPHEQRYTKEWDRHLPVQLRAATGMDVISITGDRGDHTPTAGAFLDFAATNIFKGQQIAEIGARFQNDEVMPGDIFVFTDAWHTGVLNVAYMRDLLKVPVKIIVLWHAGQYDEHDFLGRIANREWASHAERAIFAAADINAFATRFHAEMFKQHFSMISEDQVLVTGWPMEYLRDTLNVDASAKRKLVLFPHRLAPEKQVETFRDLASSFPDYEFRVCQDQKLSKQEYHSLLRQSAVVFSASLQETLGIGLYEGLLCGALPVAPARLSYTEMYPGDLLYPEHWTSSWDKYLSHKAELVVFMARALEEAASPGWICHQPVVSAWVGERFHGQCLYTAVRSLANSNSNPEITNV